MVEARWDGARRARRAAEQRKSDGVEGLTAARWRTGHVEEGTVRQSRS
jgi:hypothetical protein